MHRRTCLFSGHVQGVGFRYTAHNLALQYDVHGYVRNLSDGRVELVMEGPDSDMDQLLENLRQRLGDLVDDAAISTSPATGEFRNFAIRH